MQVHMYAQVCSCVGTLRSTLGILTTLFEKGSLTKNGAWNSPRQVLYSSLP